jgi:hypothetical protein
MDRPVHDVAEEARADAYIAVGKAKHIVLRAIQHVGEIGDFPVGSVHPAVYHDRYVFLRETRAQYVDGLERRITSVKDAKDILNRCRIVLLHEAR